MKKKIDLPVPNFPKLRGKFPISGKEFFYRPFSVGEDRILLFAVESEEPQEITDAIFRVLRNCTFNEIDVENMNLVDLEYLLIRTRSSSRGEVIPLYFRCENEVDKPQFDENGEIESHKKEPCNHVTEIKVDLRQIEIEDSKVKDTILIDKEQDIGIKLKIPTSRFLNYYVNNKDPELKKPVNIILNSIAEYIDSIWYGDTVIPANEIDRQQLIELYIERLTKEQFDHIKEYIDKAPFLKLVVNFECEECGHKQNYTVKRLNDFLRLMFAEESIVLHYKINHRMITNGYRLEDIDQMMPFERDIYHKLILADLRDNAETAERIKQMKQSYRMG